MIQIVFGFLSFEPQNGNATTRWNHSNSSTFSAQRFDQPKPIQDHLRVKITHFYADFAVHILGSARWNLRHFLISFLFSRVDATTKKRQVEKWVGIAQEKSLFLLLSGFDNDDIRREAHWTQQETSSSSWKMLLKGIHKLRGQYFLPFWIFPGFLFGFVKMAKNTKKREKTVKLCPRSLECFLLPKSNIAEPKERRKWKNTEQNRKSNSTQNFSESLSKKKYMYSCYRLISHLIWI